MEKSILEELQRITPEEQRLLDGEKSIDDQLYLAPGGASEHHNIYDSRRLLEAGRLITIRKHTRFVHFPKHTHNYVEVIYMCTGTTHHVINGNDVILNQGELLFLNQNASQEIYPAGEKDIAVNFIILPEFFDYALKMIDSEENLLREFVVGCLRGEAEGAGYLHFKVADVLPVQNLVENLIWSLMNRQPNRRSINQATMGLLFVQLLNQVDKVETEIGDDGQKLVMTVLSYIEEHYKDGELTELAQTLHYDIYWLSKEIKKRTGQTYIDLRQSKRLSQACYLLTHTGMSVEDIGIAVGYENKSYFHRIFQERYGCTPKKYRISK